jgi:hypothetical protein
MSYANQTAFREVHVYTRSNATKKKSDNAGQFFD